MQLYPRVGVRSMSLLWAQRFHEVSEAEFAGFFRVGECLLRRRGGGRANPLYVETNEKDAMG